MSEYFKNSDYAYTLDRLREACVNMPYELQLVWMFEICVIKCYLFGRATTRHKITTHKKYADRDVAYARYLVVYAEECLNISSALYNHLYNYRNSFVHQGRFEAQFALTDFMCNISSEELDTLQQTTGVTLNLRKSIMIEL